MKVSVIMTTYNSAINLQRSLPSVLGQSGIGSAFELELLVVDNCSTDNTVNVLQSLGVMYIQNERNTGGPNTGRNRGLEMVSGDYICFMDDDDIWHPEKILLQLKAAQIAPIITTSYTSQNLSTGQQFTYGLNNGTMKVFESNVAFKKKLMRAADKQQTYMSTIMIHKSLKHIRFEENFNQLDFDWLLRLLEHNTSVQVMQTLVTRFVHDKNLSLTAPFRRLDYYYTLMIMENYMDTYPKEVHVGTERLQASKGKYHYLKGEMDKARKYFSRNLFSPKNAMYYLTTFYGSHWVKRKFPVFG